MLIKNILKKNISADKQKGFTLVEIMVAVSIFAIVMVVALGSILAIVDANRKAQAIHNVINNLNLAIESMARDLRTGVDHHCSYVADPHCTSSPSAINLSSFQEANRLGFPDSTVDIVYARREDGSGRGYIVKIDSASDEFVLTSDNIDIEHLSFSGYGVDRFSSRFHPRILIRIKGKVTAYGEDTEFSLQTLVSPRTLDL